MGTIHERVSEILVGLKTGSGMTRGDLWEDGQHSISGGAPSGIAGFEKPSFKILANERVSSEILLGPDQWDSLETGSAQLVVGSIRDLARLTS